jgi:hypothetical protein
MFDLGWAGQVARLEGQKMRTAMQLGRGLNRSMKVAVQGPNVEPMMMMVMMMMMDSCKQLIVVGTPLR